MTVKQLIDGLRKYNPNLQVVQGDVYIKEMRIHMMPIMSSPDGHVYLSKSVVRLIRDDEKRA